METIEKRIGKRIKNDSVLIEFLGAENVDRLKREITDAIIQQVIEDLHNSFEYIIDPDDMVQDIVDDIVRSTKEKIRPKVEKKLYEETMKKLGLEA